jgi:hypothetical protein
LHNILMNILSFSFLYFCIYIIKSIVNIIIWIIDSINCYDSERKAEIMKWEGNVVNGILGLKRDANLLSLVFFHSYDDIREVYI